jgi:hypothetical protein
VVDYVIAKGGGGSQIRRWNNHQYLFGHSTRSFAMNITEHEKSLIYGTLLGDSSICRPYTISHRGKPSSPTPRLRFNHGSKQKEWAFYKAEKLSSLHFSCKITENPGYGDLWASCSSIAHPSLEEIYSVVCSSDKKIVTKEWLGKLNDEAVAWWFMDDYSLSNLHNQGVLHTEGFSENECKIIKEFMIEYFSIPEELIRLSYYKEKYYAVRFRKKALDTISERIGKYFVKSMEYKLPDSYRNC